jgi:hypothetical protein
LTTFATSQSASSLGRRTGRTTGMTVGGDLAQLTTYREGKAIRVRDFGSHPEALEAAGLPE